MQETAARHLGRMFQLIAFSMKQEKSGFPISMAQSATRIMASPWCWVFGRE